MFLVKISKEDPSADHFVYYKPGGKSPTLHCRPKRRYLLYCFITATAIWSNYLELEHPKTKRIIYITILYNSLISPC